MAYVDTRERGTLFLRSVEWWRNWCRMRRGLTGLWRSYNGRAALADDLKISPGNLRTIAAKWPGQAGLIRSA
jgi:hypothetical protein